MFIKVKERWYYGALVGRYEPLSPDHTIAEIEAIRTEQDKFVDTLKALKMPRYPNPGWTVGNGIHANLVTEDMLMDALVVSARDWLRTGEAGKGDAA